MTDNEAKKEIGDNIRYQMEDARMTPSELARVSGLSKASISLYLAGERYPSVKALVNLAEALCCDYDDLLPIKDRID